MDALGFGLFSNVPGIAIAVTGLCTLWLGFIGAPLLLWSVLIAGALWGFGVPVAITGAVVGLLILANIGPIRTMLISAPILKVLKSLNVMPKISETERVALEAGATWVDGELFSGKPNFDKINAEQYPSLSQEEQDFLNGPVEDLCAMVTDWEIFQNADLPDRVWDYLKEHKFFGMIVPKEHGGLGYSALCHSEVVQKLTSRSVPLAVTVMVPNSLGPAELILHYGTDEQKKKYLPRLASGLEIPCFALTEAGAGSDAGSMTSSGEVFRAKDGSIHIRLNWQKRYITLAAVSSLIGLAIKLRDPDNILGKGVDLGITCVLVPSATKGVKLGERHNPMGVPFYNCPTYGENVEVSLGQVIGGAEGAGHGWQMLMESLAAGRSISLPAQSLGTSKLVTRATSAYASFREQFGMAIGRFEGIEERLAQIYGLTYLMESTRRFTAGAVDSGIKPAVVSAIAKCYMTELSRKIINDGMDVLGGAGISRGPNNLLANPYIGAPIGITVEGANILTRSMIIYGQGAIRCHPFVYDEFQAVENGDVKAFDKAFWGHVGFVVRNTCRAIVLSVTRGRLASVPSGPHAVYYRKLAWSSAVFAVLSDVAMGTLGGKLKFSEKLTGRLADVLGWMYLASATLRRFEAGGRDKDELPYLHWSMKYAMNEIQDAFDGIFKNFPVPFIGLILRGPVAFWSRINRLDSMPSDELGHQVVHNTLKPGKMRDALTTGIFIPKAEGEILKLYEDTFEAVYAANGVWRQLRKAVAKKKLPKKIPQTQLIQMAVDSKIITAEDASLIRRAVELRERAIQVDSFKLKDFETGHMESNVRKIG